MKVILREDVENLGSMGDIVTVAEGYARNYLVPKKLAVEANTKNIREFQHQKTVIQKRAAKIKESSSQLAERLSAVTLTVKAQAGEEDKIFGSVTTKDVAEGLQAQGFEIDKKKISIDEPIKRLGVYSVNVKVHPEVTAQVKVQVVAETPDA